ncbi:EscU/YscU/HrcU family type III secretion system export apparatus switch protein [Congregibacter variabilis]|uniref:Flagellar biosynthetic protein FlhB n=1 Tax=Congregibacter variabilis TaxID=3081200 RepID=A0ABZ0I1F5_9GAMM|nr:EscU/YscU/HrcU family type III secretion system export apparatus switch protein [Congregibacter sp. IMCC43200]
MSDTDKRSSRPVTQSAALSYSGEGAPVLVAKGENAIADRIVELAAENGVPIVQDGQLTELLCQIPLGDEVPPALYVAVAEVLAYVYRLNEQLDRRV